MAATEGGAMEAAQPQQQQQARAADRLNPAVQQQLNLDSVKTRAISLYKAISRILEELEVIGRTNTVPKWQDVLGQFSMVNLELFNIVEDIKKVSKAFVVHPKFVTADNATILPVMLSSKLLPEIEMDDNAKKDQLLHGMQNMPVSQQIEKLKMRIDMIGAACESAEKVIADTRKAYFGSRQGLTTVPTMDKVQAAKIQEQETSLRNAVNHGEGLRAHGDQKQITTSLPLHLVDVLTAGDGGQTFPDASGMYVKNTPIPSNNINNQGNLIQASGAQLIGKAAASPSAAGVVTGVPSFDNAAASPMQYANSPRSGASMMNTPSPQQHSPQQQQQQLQQQRQKMMPLPQHQQQQLMTQQQFRQPALSGLGQNQLGQLHDMQGQAQQKFQSMHGQHQMQFSSAMGTQQFQSRQLPSGAMQHAIGQNQLNQSNQMNRHMNQFSNASSALFNNIGQTSPNPQMIPNMSATMSSQSLLPRMQQFGLSGGNRMHGSQILSDQMFNMGAANPGNMMPMQQQHGSQGGSFGNMPQNAQQNLQSNMVALQQNHPNFQQQRQQQNQP